MKRTFAFCLTATLLLSTAHRAPAPISETETPTPVPEQSAKPKPKRTTKPKTKSEANEAPVNSVRQQPNHKQSRFAGTWVGTMQTFPMGNVAAVIVVDATERTMAVSCIGPGNSVPVKNAQGWPVASAKLSGDALQANFPAGIATTTWSITPAPDGATARVRMQGALNDFTAVFHRTAN